MGKYSITKRRHSHQSKILRSKQEETFIVRNLEHVNSTTRLKHRTTTTTATTTTSSTFRPLAASTPYDIEQANAFNDGSPRKFIAFDWHMWHPECIRHSCHSSPLFPFLNAFAVVFRFLDENSTIILDTTCLLQYAKAHTPSNHEQQSRTIELIVQATIPFRLSSPSANYLSTSITVHTEYAIIRALFEWWQQTIEYRKRENMAFVNTNRICKWSFVFIKNINISVRNGCVRFSLSLSQRRTWKIQTSVDNQNTVGYQYKSSGRQWCTSTLASFIHWFFSWRGRDGCLKWTELSARDKYVGIMPSLFMHSSENRITMNETICLRSRTTSTVIASPGDCFFWNIKCWTFSSSSLALDWSVTSIRWWAPW